ncbi:MAG TPA: hypothetical protein VEX62_02115 [Candidatus Limnocylindrales bacterium]|nr:hypothetical protein [Candidatus Limnocylindrales bacterium]
MSRLPIVTVAMGALLAAGCVSIGSPTALPSATPSLGITTPAPSTAAPSPSPSAAPTASPTVAPTEAPTATAQPTGTSSAAPTDSAAPSGSPGTSPAVPIVYGADTLLYYDDFSDPNSGWGVGTNAGGTVAYADGGLRFDPAAIGAWIWSRREANEPWNVMRVEGSVTPSHAGYTGLLCSADDDDLYGAVANADGVYIFVHLTSAGVEVISNGQEPGWALTPGVTTSMALDCAGTNTGALRLQFSLPDVSVVVSHEGTEGPPNFDRAAVYAESGADGHSLLADDVYVYGGADFTGGQSSGNVDELLAHVPAEWRASCFETPISSTDAGAQVAVACSLDTGNADIAEYVLFDSQANMDVAYQARIDSWSVEPTGDCQTGPNETGYSVGGVSAGRALCAPQTVGVRLDWTHNDLLILSNLTDFEGSYADNYEDWLIAGPV